MIHKKKVRGSAYTTNEGMFIFTPYLTLKNNEKPLQLIKSGTYSHLWISKNKITIHLSFNRQNIPPFEIWIKEISTLYDTLQTAKIYDN